LAQVSSGDVLGLLAGMRQLLLVVVVRVDAGAAKSEHAWRGCRGGGPGTRAMTSWVVADVWLRSLQYDVLLLALLRGVRR
jgi:hypothetical protein